MVQDRCSLARRSPRPTFWRYRASGPNFNVGRRHWLLLSQPLVIRSCGPDREVCICPERSGKNGDPGPREDGSDVFDDDGSYIEHKQTGQVTPLSEVGGFYKLKMWVPKNQSCLF